MTTTLILAAVALAPQATRTPDDKFFADLLRWRIQFEEVIVDSPNTEAYHTVGSETLGGAHGRGFYPVGSASERYMLSFNADVILIYQKRVGSKVIEPWSVKLVKSSSKAPVKGTIPKHLQTLGYRIPANAKLSKAARRELAKSDTFAGYMYHHLNGGLASIIKPNGQELKEPQSTEDAFFITEEEKEILRKRKKG